MPIYNYKGKNYKLSETDPAVAKAKIQKSLGEGQSQPQQGAAEFYARETARPLLKSAADVVGFIPDVATDVANLVPESILGSKVQRPSDYLRGKIDEYIPKAQGASERMEDVTAMVPQIAPAVPSALKAGGKLISKASDVVSREFSKDLMPKAQAAYEKVRTRFLEMSKTAEGRAAAEKEGRQFDIESQYTRDQLDAHAKAEHARIEAQQKAAAAARPFAQSIRENKANLPNPEMDIPEARKAAGLPDPTNNAGERLRSDLATKVSELTGIRNEAEVYSGFDARLDQKDLEDPFSLSKNGGRGFMLWMDRIVNPPAGKGVIKASKDFEDLVKRTQRKLTGRPYNEIVEIPQFDMMGFPAKPKSVVQPTERPRFGRAVFEQFQEIRHAQAEAYRDGNKALGDRYRELGDKLETAITEWTGQEIPSEQWRKLSEPINKLVTPAVERTLEKVGSPHLKPDEKHWATNSSDLMNLWFSGPDRAAELRSALGEEKFSQYALERVSSEIQNMSPAQINEWAKLEKNKWVDTVPGLRTSIEKFSEHIAKRSGTRESIEAVIKGHKQAIDEIGKEMKSALKAARVAKEQALKTAGKARDVAFKDAEKTAAAQSKGAEYLANFMTGKTPVRALESFDGLVNTLKTSGGFTDSEIATIRSQLESAAKIQNVSDRNRALRRWAYAALGLSEAANLTKTVAGKP